ncbi:hypothetical protein MAM1_0150d06650 [Mucor ambiguus]|uniref:Uncharacterized protein n=1 Tax=Mucor ambiguus TaxID=91626 RepID=A0A0C9MUN3_9FUNG|nr:hypothetical protein MAM1_0150d06650 [Mucor ambiguus]
MTASHKQQQQHTFQAIIVHVENQDCSRDVLVSPAITLNQLNKHLLNAFDIHEHHVDYYQFFQNDDKLEIETCFGLIGDQQQELDGFLTPIAPGVYIEHSHPHEPLPSFSLYKHNAQQDASMSFRLLRDERHVRLNACCFASNIFYEFHYMQLQYGMQLELKTVDLPVQFLDTITSAPKIIRRRGDLFTTQSRVMKRIMMAAATTRTRHHHKSARDGLAHGDLHKSFDEIDEQSIREACRSEIERLKEERRLFLLDQKRTTCNWVEPSGDHCAYCTLL